MPRFPFLLSFAALVLSASYVSLARTHSSPASQTIPSRTFVFTYQVHVPATKDPQGKLLVWLPLPQQDDYQTIRDVQIESPVAYSKGREPEYGNSYILFQPTPAQLEAGFDISMHFIATRYEHKVSLDPASANRVAMNTPATPDLQRYLEPDTLVPLDGVIADLAKEHTAGDTTALAKAHDIYNYVLATMRYDKSGEGWGRGDAVWACTSKRGNCTDFHSLFIGMMRASGIPARFEIGFPLPDAKTEGEIPGYHCWAEFYLNGTGWVPVDASEAWKNPAKRDYFFGAHDVNRVLFTYGRDVRLSPQQQRAPLNYFIYPYAELDGKPFSGLQSHFSFRDLPANAPSSASR
jgi:transglutaminase-like putative cysteine protease